MGKRIMRDTEEKPDLLIKPFDLTKFGTKDDPCFGKFFDLSAEECRQCGDSELCAIALAQNQIKKRKEIESKESFKDMEDAEQDIKEKNIQKYIRKKVKKGLTVIRAMKRASKKYDIPLHRIKEIHKNK